MIVMTTNQTAMKDAWALARKGSRRYGGRPSDYFRMALVLAWKALKRRPFMTKLMTKGKSKMRNDLNQERRYDADALRYHIKIRKPFEERHPVLTKVLMTTIIAAGISLCALFISEIFLSPIFDSISAALDIDSLPNG